MIALVGPTASGKSDLAMRLAARIGGEIISVDSMQVYRGMDIGTAKPTPTEQRAVPHHMIDLVDVSEEYDAASFQAAARAAIDDIQSRDRTPLIVGGSGLHFRATVDPYTFAGHDRDVRAGLEASDPAELRERLVEADPHAGTVLDLDNPRRVIRALEILTVDGRTPTERANTPERLAVAGYQPLIPFEAIGIDPGDDVAERARLRVDAMVVDGLVDEVAALAPTMGRTARQAVGYKELLPVVEDDADLYPAQEAVHRATVALARRQRTFFRRDPRVRWLPWHPSLDERSRLLEEALST